MARAAAVGVGVAAGKKDQDSEIELSQLRMIAPHYWLPGSGVPESPPLWYPYLPAYSPQAAAAAAAALAGGYKLVPDSATGNCYLIPGQCFVVLLLTCYLWGTSKMDITTTCT